MSCSAFKNICFKLFIYVVVVYSTPWIFPILILLGTGDDSTSLFTVVVQQCKQFS